MDVISGCGRQGVSTKMDNKPSILGEIPPRRRSFVQTILGMAGYSVPSVRTFVIGSAVALSEPAALYAITHNDVPEIAPDSTATALTLLAGGAALIAGGRGRSKKQTEEPVAGPAGSDEQR